MEEDTFIEWKEEGGRYLTKDDTTIGSILGIGWRIGKKMMIASAAISSAPIVLPPLVIFSTIGFAFAVPFGFVFVTYACTDKIMKSLLPMPVSPIQIPEDYDYFMGEENEEPEIKREIMEGEPKIGDSVGDIIEWENGMEHEREVTTEKQTRNQFEEQESGKEDEEMKIGDVPAEEGFISVSEIPPETKESESSETSSVEKPVWRSVSLDLPVSKLSEKPVETKIFTPSPKVMYNEDKIWEQIHAMETLVGYKASRKGSYIDRINALYLFTGVEPPPSSKGDLSLREVNDKLKFLKSIIGVM